MRFWLWLERIFLLAGICLILLFAGMKIQQGDASAAGIASFYQQAHAASINESSSGPVQAAEPSLEIIKSPNFELWSPKRVEEYQATLVQDTEPPLGILRIGRLDIEVPVYNGTDEFILNRGVGRIIGTARLDDQGNLGLAGHRDGFFRGLKDIELGDVLELQTTRGVVRYRVGSTVIVDPSDVSVLAPTDNRTITLVTCYPFYFVGHAPKRFIVQATADSEIVLN